METTAQHSAQEILTDEAPPSRKMITVMGGIGLIAGILIVFTYQTTLPFVKANKQRMLENAIFEVVPGAATKKVFIVNDANEVMPLTGEDEKAFKLYACYSESGQLTGVAVEARGQGFQDVIHVIYGFSPEKQAIVGMKVLESLETPGLGDKIGKDPKFLANFTALDVRLNPEKSAILHPLELVKSGQKTEKWQIDAITGATISSTAVARMLKSSTEKNIPLIMKNLSRLQGEGS